MNSELNLTSPAELQALFSKYGFSLNKSLGQNFLINPAVCPKMAELAIPDKDFTALEIGPGAGVLTRELSKRCKRVIAVETDRKLQPLLEETLAGFSNTEIIFGDALTLDFSVLLAPGEHYVCCANLPYYITTPLIMKLLEQRLPLENITVMVQKEAGVRLLAPPGVRECGAVSAAIRFFSEPEKLFDVKRTSFMPPPTVDSVVIRLNVKSQLPDADEKTFFRITKCVFAQRRKQAAGLLSAEFGLNKQLIASVLPRADSRAENLTSEDLLKLSDFLYENTGH